MKIAVVAYKYAVEVSPTVKNVCTYFRDRGHKVVLFLDHCYCSSDFDIPGVDMIRRAGGDALWVRLCVRLLRFRLFDQLWFKGFVDLLSRRKVSDHDMIVAADFRSLDALYQAGVPLERVMYLALENTGFMRGGLLKSYVRDILKRCRWRLVQDAARAANINEFLGADLSFSYLPVSCRPFKPSEIACPADPLRIVYSGYFADWSYLKEFLPAILGCDLSRTVFEFHGHSMGTKDYYTDLAERCAGRGNIRFLTRYMADEEHTRFLSGFHAGIALYKTDDIGNFENILFASGKIASYLWAGLAVITNIDTPLTRQAPFIFLPDLSVTTFRERMRAVSNAAGQAFYCAAALRLAHERYDFDQHMDAICVQMFPLSSGDRSGL